MGDEMVDALKNQINTTNVFLLSFNAQDERMNTATQQMLREMEALFGYAFWNNTILEATHWAYDQKSIWDREDEGHTEEWWINDKNENLRELFHLDHNLTAVFIDSYAKHGHNVEDDTQQEYFNRETAKLWELTNSLPSFAFRTLEDVLADLDTCTRTLEGDIAELKAEMLEVKQNFTEVEEMLTQETYERKKNDGTLTDNVANVELELSGNVTAIQKNVTKQINDVYAEMDTDFTEIQDEVLQLQNNLTQLHISPIGSIIMDK